MKYNPFIEFDKSRFMQLYKKVCFKNLPPKKLAINSILLLVKCSFVIALLLMLLRFSFGVHILINSLSIVLGVVGTVLIFVGNIFVSDALGKYDLAPHYVFGNKLEAIGFVFLITALFVK